MENTKGFDEKLYEEKLYNISIEEIGSKDAAPTQYCKDVSEV